MTKEELKLEAENKLDEWSDPDMGCCEGYCYSEVADFMFRFAEPREEHIAELEAQIEQLQKINSKQKEMLKKVRIALIQERTANIVNYGKGGVEMFEDMLESLKGVSN
jgi:hypothetical protein